MSYLLIGVTIVLSVMVASLISTMVVFGLMFNKKFITWFTKKYMKLIEDISGDLIASVSLSEDEADE